MKYLITPTLLNSFLFFQKDTREEATEEFLNTLNKEFKTNELIEKGNKYEQDLISGVVKDEFTPYVENGLYQVVLKKDIKINNIDFILYGKADVIKENYIYDIKRTKQYQYLKYQSSMQHRIYMYCSGIHNFKYLINENDSIRYIEEYQYTKYTENEIMTCIMDFMDTINFCEEFKTAFNKNFISKY